MIEHAGESDEHIHTEWEEWEEAVGRLMSDEVCPPFLISS